MPYLPVASIAPPGLHGPPGLNEVKLPIAALAPPGHHGPPGFNEPLLPVTTFTCPPGFHGMEFPESQAWWWLQDSMGGKQAPWMSMTQYEPTEPISLISSDSSPTGCGHWWQRRDRFWTGSTMADSVFDSTVDTEEPGTSDDEDGDDEDADCKAIMLEEVGECDDWTVAGDISPICDLFDEDVASPALDAGGNAEKTVADGDGSEFQVMPVAEELSASEELEDLQKPAVGWKTLIAEEASEVVLSASDFPLLSAVQPRRRGGSL